MEKYTWQAVIKEGMKEEYIRRHDTIWPEMAAVLKEGRRMQLYHLVRRQRPVRLL